MTVWTELAPGCFTTDQATCEAIARGRHTPAVGSSAELRCGVCREPIVAIGHVHATYNTVTDETHSGLCIHERTKAGRRKHMRDPDGRQGFHEDYIGLTADRDMDADVQCTWKCRRGHRLRETAGAILADIERGRTVVYLDSA